MSEVYGICYGDGADTTVLEMESLEAADREAVTVATSEGQTVDVVVLESSGPVYDSDGEQIASVHAPARTLYTVRPV